MKYDSFLFYFNINRYFSDFLLSDLYGYNFGDNIKFASDSEMDTSSSESESESEDDDDDNENDAEAVPSSVTTNVLSTIDSSVTETPIEHFVVPSFSYVEKKWGPCTPNVRVYSEPSEQQEFDDDCVVDLDIDRNDILLEECNKEDESAGVQQQLNNTDYEDGEIVSSTVEETISHSRETETLRTPCSPLLHNNNSNNNNVCINSNVINSDDGSRMYITPTGQRFAVKRVSALTRTRSPEPKIRKLHDEKEL